MLERWHSLLEMLRLPLVIVILLLMAALPLVFAPENSLLGIPDPALVLFAAGQCADITVGRIDRHHRALNGCAS